MKSALAPGMSIAIERSHATTPMSMEAERCKTCSEFLVYTPDAIGRLRARCPRCQGVAKQRPRPNAVLVPMRLGELTTSELPAIAPGQLRCQVCAQGVEKESHRFCPSCQHERRGRPNRRERPVDRRPRRPNGRAIPSFKEKRCLCGCETPFAPSGPRQRYRPECAARVRRALKTQWNAQHPSTEQRLTVAPPPRRRAL